MAKLAHLPMRRWGRTQEGDGGCAKLRFALQKAKCVHPVEARIPAPGPPAVWQYVSLPRGAPRAGRGGHLENRILRGSAPMRVRTEKTGIRHHLLL